VYCSSFWTSHSLKAPADLSFFLFFLKHMLRSVPSSVISSSSTTFAVFIPFLAHKSYYGEVCREMQKVFLVIAPCFLEASMAPL
jgi:hypothetical protein